MPTGNTYPTSSANITPASGPIKFSDLNKAFAITPGTSLSLSWVKARQKVPKNKLSEDYSHDFYQRNIDGNCDNGNCVESLGSGNINCVNCVINGTVNCSNCDTTNYLQTNCNCACTYNCTTTTRSYNCNCNCLCHCAWSDDALKDRYTNIENPLEIINELNGFYYQGNQIAKSLGLNLSKSVGVSAQEIAKVLPEALGPNMGDYKTVDYERIVPVLIEAIKELNKKIDSK